MTVGVAIMLGMLAIRRDTRQRTAEVLESWPLGNGTWLTAKYVACYTYLSLFTLAFAVIGVTVYAQHGMSAAKTWQDISFLVGQYAMSYAVSLALGMALATWIRHRIVYLIGFCAWMFGTFFMEMYMIDRYDWQFLRTFHLNQLLRGTDWAHDVWGAALASDELLRSRLFVALFTLTLLAAIVITRYVRRPGRAARLWQVGGVVVCCAMLAAGTWYQLLWSERAETKDLVYRLWVERGEEEDSVWENTDKTAARVTSYAIDVMKTGQRGLTVGAQFDLDLQGLGQKVKEVPFTLEPLFQLESVAVDGKKVKFHRSKNLLTIPRDQFPEGAQKVTVNVRYSGDVFVMSRDKTVAFVHDKQLLLLGSYLDWYPLPYNDQFENSIAGMAEKQKDRVPFKVTVGGFPGRVYSSLAKAEGRIGRQTFSGDAWNRLSLVAGDVTDIAYKGLHVIASPWHVEEGKKMLRYLADDAYPYYDAWLGNRYKDRRPTTFFYLPLERAYFSLSWLKENKVAFIHTWPNRSLEIYAEMAEKLHRRDEYLANVREQLYDHLFKNNEIYVDEEEQDKNDVTEAVRGAYVYMYLREKRGWTHDEVMELFINTDAGEGDGEVDDQKTAKLPRSKVFAMLGRAFDDGKSAQVKKLLRAYYPQCAAYGYDDSKVGYGPRIMWDEWQAKWKEFGL